MRTMMREAFLDEFVWVRGTDWWWMRLFVLCFVPSRLFDFLSGVERFSVGLKGSFG